MKTKLWLGNIFTTSYEAGQCCGCSKHFLLITWGKHAGILCANQESFKRGKINKALVILENPQVSILDLENLT